MKILLIQPNLNQKNRYFNKIAKKILPLQSLTLAQLAALTPDKHELTCIDESNQKIDFNDRYDLVGISCNTPLASRAYYIAEKFKSIGAKVVLGGVHPTALPHEAKKHADSIIIGEGEMSYPALIKDIEKNGKIKPFYKSNFVASEKIPSPDHSYSKTFNIITKVQATRGCPYKCEFCSLHIIEGRKYRTRPIKQVIKELKGGSKNIVFVDNSLTIDIAYTKELFKQMQNLGKKFACFGNINILGKDEKLLGLAEKAGCVLWQVGLESVSQESLKETGKNINKVNDYRNSIKLIKKYNMAVAATFIFGFDHDTPQIFDQTLEAIQNLELDTISCCILTPYPGTKLFKRLEKEKRILTKDWSKYDLGHLVFKPKKLSEEDLLEGARRIIKNLSSPMNLITRSLNSMKLGFYPFCGTVAKNFSSRSMDYPPYFKNLPFKRLK